MRVQLSILLFVGLFVGLLAVRSPEPCRGFDLEGVKCPETGMVYLPVPGKCGKLKYCVDGCPILATYCPDCSPYNTTTRRCMRTGRFCDQCFQ